MNNNEILLSLIKEKCVKKGDFQLSSGVKSNLFIDLSKISLTSNGIKLISSAIFFKLKFASVNFTALGGPTMGADPIVGALLNRYGDTGLNRIKGFLVRKEPKDGKLVEGADLDSSDSVVIIEDVVTTGGQVLKAVDAVEKFGAKVAMIASVIDREAGAKEVFAQRNISYCSIFSLQELLAE